MNEVNRIMCLDYGSRRIGVAISDPLRLSAQPYQTIHYVSEKDLWRQLDEIHRNINVETMVLGLPLNMNGSEGALSRAVRALAQKLEKRYPSVAITFWDERLSTRVAERTLRESGHKPSRRRGQVDQLAAVWILQGFLDRLSGAAALNP